MSSSIISYIDHTCLAPDATASDIQRVCDEAVERGFFGVCIAPHHVEAAVTWLADSSVRVVSVAGFPRGDVATEIKIEEARRALGAGAVEVDMVMRVGAAKRGEFDAVADDIAAVADVVHQCESTILKVILEAAVLTREEIVTSCRAAVKSGADFVKTSTGVSPAGGASIDTVRLMRGVVGEDVGVKAAGGIQDYETAVAMIAAGASRIGTSASVAIVLGEKNRVK